MSRASGIGAGIYTNRIIAYRGFCRDTLSVTTAISAGSDEPTMACHANLQVSLSGSGTLITPGMMLPGQNLTNKITFIEGSNTNIVNCSDIGKDIRVVALDTLYNQKCWGNVIVKDNSVITATARDTIISCLQSMDSLTAERFLTISDNCSTLDDVEVTFSDNFDVNSCGTGGDTLKVINRTWIIKDPSGAIVNANSKITVTKISLDTIVFPPDTTLYCPDTISNVGVLNFNIDTLLTQCKLQIGYSDTEIPVGCSGMRKIERNWVVIDWCNNNRKDTTQIITLLDTVPPVLTCPIGDIQGRRLIKTSIDTCGAYFVFPDVIAHDSCSDDSLIEYVVRANGIIVTDLDSVLLPIGQSIMEYRATDDCGYTSMCQDTIQVEDGTPPSINGPSIIQVALAGNGNTLIPINLISGAFNIRDNCALDSVFIRRLTNTCGVSTDTIFGSSINICCADADTLVPIELMVKDKAGLASQIIRTNIDVKDPISPSLTCIDTTVYLDSNGNFAIIDSSYFISSFSDNCSNNVSFEYSLDTLNRTHLGAAVPLLVTIKDVEGNSDTCTSMVTVLDTFPAVMGLIIGQVVDPYSDGLGGMDISLLDKAGTVLNNATTDAVGGFKFEEVSSIESSVISINGYGEMMEGVSSIDLYLIQKHILGLTPFNNVYLELAADIDRSGSLSVADLLHLQNALLGRANHFDLPWLYLLENKNANTVYVANEVIPFVNSDLSYRAIKMGDINGNIYHTASGRSMTYTELLLPNIDLEKQVNATMPIYLMVGNDGLVSFKIQMKLENISDISFSKNLNLPFEIEFDVVNDQIVILGYGDNELNGKVNLGELNITSSVSSSLRNILRINSNIVGELYNIDYEEINLRLGWIDGPNEYNEN